MISGTPESICIVPARTAGMIARPPCSTDRPHARNSHGIQLEATRTCGHTRLDSITPLKVNSVPPKAAANGSPVHTRSSRYIPAPPRTRCARQKKPSDQGSGRRS
ncbi:MAG: hypothetical protein DMF49_13230 [Acidobacteria bacterium]|nr:MAG: hypothetical protein DMF49_13230 [Acidobacteriota bacterium]